ncbi:hypothetical protein [Prosthecobacter sp.]|uniref:hypothetical protein n=1 Tax=Prosthecobacter sp. TaxID=1965333 RepID=UPI003783E952
MIKKRRHPLFLFLLLMVSLLLAVIYWWSGDLAELYCGSGQPSQRAAAVKTVINIPFLRKASLVEVAASRCFKRSGGEMLQILRGRYSEAVLLDEVESQWRSKLAAGEYYKAGIMLTFAHTLAPEGFRSRVRKAEVEQLVHGLGPNLDAFLSWNWKRVVMDERAFEKYYAFTPEQRFEFTLADLKAYPLR